jgi:hypothetical protein
MLHFPSHNWCGYKKELSTSPPKKFGSVWPRVKEKTNLESFTLFFSIRQIVSSSLRPSFKVLFLGFENPHSATINARGSQWWAFFMRNHNSQDLVSKVLVANNAQGCFPILPRL